MNNRYLFRGKRVDTGEWVSGWLVHGDLIRERKSGCGLMTQNMSTDGDFECSVVRIDPATLGQCTGITAAKSYRGDMPEDRLVFEGDLIKVKVVDFGNLNVVYKVVFEDYSWKLSKVSQSIAMSEDYYFSSIWFSELTDEEYFYNIEIIGTIHEKEWSTE